MSKHAVIALSGGMDSSTLLLRLLKEQFLITAISFDYDQKHKIELEKAQELISYLLSKGHYVKHRIVKIEGLAKLLNSNLVIGGDEVPEGHYREENMKLTVVPNRNKIFSSITQAIALSLSTQFKCDVVIALGIHAGDHSIYPDCRQEFRDADLIAFRLGNWGAERVDYYTPYLQMDKYEILKDGLSSCDYLDIDFDEVYMRTNTSYKPIFIGNNAMPDHPDFGGKWYSDYKSASSVERILAFYQLGIPDPVQYADETGLVSWDAALKHVLEVEKNFRNSSDKANL